LATSPFWRGDWNITQGFGQQSEGHYHTGIDFGMWTGTPLMAPSNGRIEAHPSTCDIEDHRMSCGYGNHIIFYPDDAPNIRVILAHFSSFVLSDGPVTAGQVLGYSGTSGYSTGPHLHFEVQERGKAIDPSAYLAGVFSGGGGVPQGALPGTNAFPDIVGLTKGKVDPLAAVGQQIGTLTKPIGQIGALAGTVGGFVSKPSNWWRVGFTGVSALFILMGLIIYVQSLKPVQETERRAAGAAAKVA
jgi:hypothetical protein